MVRMAKLGATRTYDFSGYTSPNTTFNLKINEANVSVTSDANGFFHYNLPTGTTLTSLHSLCLNNTNLTSFTFGDRININNLSDVRSMFYGCTDLTEVNGLENLAGAPLTTVTNVFVDCSSLQTITGIENWDVSRCTDFTGMFARCYELVSVSDLSGWDTSNVTNVSAMFVGDTKLAGLDIRKCNLSGVTSYNNFVPNVSSLAVYYDAYHFNESIRNQFPKVNWVGCNEHDLSGITTPNTTFNLKINDANVSVTSDNNGFFYYDIPAGTTLTSLSKLFSGVPLKKFVWGDNIDTSHVTTMDRMFAGCSNLTEVLGCQKLDTSSNTTTLNIFLQVSLLEYVEGIGDWDMSGVTDMGGMFAYCPALTGIDIKDWNVSSVTNMASFVTGDSGLIELDLSGWVGLRGDVNIRNGFTNCTSLEILDIRTWDTSQLTTQYNYNNMFLNDTTTIYYNGRQFNNAIVSAFPNCTWVDVVGHDISGITIPNDTFNIKINNSDVSITSDANGYFYYDIPSGTTLTSLRRLFYNRNNITTVSFGSAFDTSQVTNMSEMFSGCNGLQTITGLDNLNTTSVTTMKGMFENCYSLTSLQIVGLDTSRVTDMSGMFHFCYGLTSLNLPLWNTSSVTDMSNMFYGCNNLSSLDISGWDTTSVTTMEGMFGYCYDLITLNISNFSTPLLTNMSLMFTHCPYLTSINMSNFNTLSVVVPGGSDFVDNSMTPTIDYKPSLWKSAIISLFRNVNWHSIE